MGRVSDDGEEIGGGGEGFEVAVDFGIEPGAADDGVGGRFHGHFLNRKGVAEDVLGEFFELSLVFRRYRFAGVEVEARVFPGEEHLDADGEEGGDGLDVFLVAGGTQAAAFAGEGQQVFVTAVVSADAGEAAVEVAAVEEFVDDLRDDGAQGTEAGLIVVRVGFDELGEVPVGALPEGRAARIAGAVEVHGPQVESWKPLPARDTTTSIAGDYAMVFAAVIDGGWGRKLVTMSV